MNNAPDNNIAYIGPTGAGLGFTLSGIHVVEVDSPEEGIKALQKMSQEKWGIIFLDTSISSAQPEVVAKLNANPLPAIVTLGGEGGADQLQELMIRAIGSDIFSNS